MKIERNKKKYRYDKKTQDGVTHPKQRIKRSALSKRVLIKGENAREFEDLRGKVLSEGCPQTEIENILCEKIISTLWKLRRASEVEQNLLNKENEITFEERHRQPFETPGRKRVTNIKQIDMGTPEVQYIIQYQVDLEKNLTKLFSRLRSEQQRNNKAKYGEK